MLNEAVSELQHSEFQYLDCVPIGILIIDSDYTICFWNEHLEKWSSVLAQERIGHNLLELYPHLQKISYKHRLESVLRGGAPATFSSLLHKELIPFASADNKYTSQYGVVKSIKTADSTKSYALISLQDLTEVSKRNELIGKYKNQIISDIKRSNEDLEEFGSIISHDLKSPLRSIKLFAKILSENDNLETDPEAQEVISKIISQVDTTATLMDSLLYYSRAGKAELAIASTDLNEVVQNIITSIEPVLEENNAKASIVGSLPKTYCDPIRLGEAFRNLIENAIKYNDNEEKLIQIGIQYSDTDEPIFYVKDNGIGIEEKNIERVFKMFHRLQNGKKRSIGTGAGLAFVKKIIDRHNGRIWIDSILGQGTTFNFTIGLKAIP